MTKSYHHISYSFIILCLIALVTSCQQRDEVPFPENPSEYQTPEVKPFKIPTGKPLKWTTIPSEKVPKAVNYPIDFSKLPSKPFDILDFNPLLSPPLAIPITWDEEIQINLDTVTGVAVPVKKQLIPQPQISKLAFLSK